MRIKALVVLVLIIGFGAAGTARSEEGIYYARCNLKVLKGTYITWVNWQAAPQFLPVNTRFKVGGSGQKVTLTDTKTGKSYTLDTGNQDPRFLEKFLSRRPVNLKAFSKDVRDNITKAVARMDMTRAQVYIAMGPPFWADGATTEGSTYEDILKTNLWVYKRRRFGKNIGVEFESRGGTVIRTEGIWR